MPELLSKALQSLKAALLKANADIETRPITTVGMPRGKRHLDAARRSVSRK